MSDEDLKLFIEEEKELGRDLSDEDIEKHRERFKRRREIKRQLPPAVYYGLKQGWDDWQDHVLNVMNIGAEHTYYPDGDYPKELQQQLDGAKKYLDIFMTEPHGLTPKDEDDENKRRSERSKDEDDDVPF